MKNVLELAAAVAEGPRMTDYGHPAEALGRVAAIWTAMLANRLGKGEALEAEDVALMMVGLKVARLMGRPGHLDSMVDIAGYARCLELIEQARPAAPAAGGQGGRP